jgi:hypothetical protein
MAGGPFPNEWIDRQVSIDFVGGTSSLTGKVTDSSEGGCVVEMVTEHDGGSRTRRVFYPWAAIRSIELLEEPAERQRPPTRSRAAEIPEDPLVP